MKYLLIILTIVLSSTTAWSKDCEQQSSLVQIKAIVANLIASEFPALKEVQSQGRLQYIELEDYENFLSTIPHVGDLFSKKKKMRLKLKINKKLYSCAPNQAALTAILFRELKHLQDYEQSGADDLIKAMTKHKSKKVKSHYERETDLFALKQGHAKGIKAYRNWIYKRLDEKALTTKKCFYYTPAEIDHWIDTKEDGMDNYFQTHCQTITK